MLHVPLARAVFPVLVVRPGPSNFVRRCISKVGLGSKTSATSIAQDARAVLSDALEGRLSEASAVASLGDDSGHARRDYNRMLSSLDYGVDPYFHTVSVKDLLKLEVVDVQLPILCPHELIGSLYTAGWKKFSGALLGGIPEADLESLLAFHWDVCKNASWADVHPAYGTHAQLNHRLIPLRMHGDDASVKSIHGRTLVIMSVHGEFGPQDPLVSRLLCTIIYNDWVVSGTTLWQIMKVWAWSFACLLAGTYPSADADGKPFPIGSRRFRLAGHAIAGSWRFVFAGALGDWSWHAKLFYPVLHGASHSFLCFRCCASRKLRRLRHIEGRPLDGVAPSSARATSSTPCR